MIATLYALSALATVLAWIVSGRCREHRAVAVLLTFGLSSDIIRRYLNAGPLAIPRPYHGMARLLFHIEQSLYIGWAFAIAALALWVLAKRRPRLIALCYAASITALGIGYPTVRGDLLRKVYLGAELLSLLIAFGALVPSLGKPSNVTKRATRIVIGGHFAAVVFGPYKVGLFDTWDLAQASYLVTYSALIAAHGVELWKCQSFSRS